MRTVFLKDSRRGKLTQFVADHILGDKHREERLAIVNVKSVTNKVRRNGGTPGPGFDGLFRSSVIQPIDFIEQLPLYVRTFFQ